MLYIRAKLKIKTWYNKNIANNWHSKMSFSLTSVSPFLCHNWIAMTLRTWSIRNNCDQLHEVSTRDGFWFYYCRYLKLCLFAIRSDKNRNRYRGIINTIDRIDIDDNKWIAVGQVQVTPNIHNYSIICINIKTSSSCTIFCNPPTTLLVV